MNKKEKEIIDSSIRELILASEDYSFMIPGETCKRGSGIYRVIMAEFVLDCLGVMVEKLKSVDCDCKCKKSKQNSEI